MLGSLRGRFILSYLVLCVVVAAMLTLVQVNGTTARRQFKGTLATDSLLTIDLSRQIKVDDAAENAIRAYVLTGNPAARRTYLRMQTALQALRRTTERHARGRPGVQ
jgi:CHASE3 domain sensor protein